MINFSELGWDEIKNKSVQDNSIKMISFTSLLHSLNLVVYFIEAGRVSGPRQVCECDRIEVTSAGGARDHVPSYLGNGDKKFSEYDNKV